MTRRSPGHAGLAAFLALIGSVLWNPPTAEVTSYSLTQAADGQDLYAERCRGNGGAWGGGPIGCPDCQ